MAFCEDDTPETRASLEKVFKQLIETGYEVKSNGTGEYNCIAFANGDTQMIWDPLHVPYTYWPRGVPRKRSLEAIMKLLSLGGYAPCADGHLEAGVEKIAIYMANDQWTHVSIQRADGVWASKLGQLQDIEHELPEHVNCDAYGAVAQFMARPRNTTKPKSKKRPD